jgi:D-3-phosphoglycerate dehydrogenase / 2-oxoglutarate reductase
MKVLVADKLEQSALDGLKAIGAEVDYQPDLKDDSLVEATHGSGAEVLVVRSTKVTKPMIDGSNLKLIIRAGAGYNTIDVDAATENGVVVANCPGKNAQAVAELAFGLIIAVDRFIPDNVAQFREGKWNKKAFGKARGLHGRTLGLVGLGNIGKDMIPRARAFGMDVIAFSQHTSEQEARELGIRLVGSPDELARQSDIVSVHTSLRPETRGLLGEAFFTAMKLGAYFINTSRCEVVDQSALERVVNDGKIFAGLDVFEDEPSTPEGTYEGSLKDNPRVYCTHHIGASTEQAQEAVAAETVRIVEEFQKTGVAPNAVNKVPAAV